MRPLTSTAPQGTARSAGLKHALLHDWQGGFPLERTPFRHVARQLGSTVREVLDQCQLLDVEGFELDVSAHWAESMFASRWRLWTDQSSGDHEWLSACLACVPGLTVWHEREQVLTSAGPRQHHAAPRLWFDLIAREHASADAQIAALRMTLPAMKWSVIAESSDKTASLGTCGSSAGEGPWQDQELARLCERGLPVVSRPYLAAASALHRSEGDVVRTLKRWQHDGRLKHVSLAPRPVKSKSMHTAAAIWGPLPESSTTTKLMSFAGVANVHEWPGAGGPTLVIAAWQPGAAENLLCRALQACGIPRQGYDLWAVRSHHVRDAPLLFADVDLPA